MREALAMLHEEGLTEVFARHQRHGDATRAAVAAVELVCEIRVGCSNSLTAILMPDGHDADRLRTSHPREVRHVARHRLGELAGRAFRIGHSARSTTSCWPARCAASKWGCAWLECRTRTAA